MRPRKKVPCSRKGPLTGDNRVDLTQDLISVIKGPDTWGLESNGTGNSVKPPRRREWEKQSTFFPPRHLSPRRLSHGRLPGQAVSGRWEQRSGSALIREEEEE